MWTVMGSAPVGDSGVLRGISRYGSSALVLDGEKVELVRAPVRPAKRGIGGGGGGDGGTADVRAAMALKSHSEAERRRRERINSHLATLRRLVPSAEKLDKAALLAEVISHVKELKSHAVEISKGFTIPSDVDEVKVKAEGDVMNNGSFLINASLCCEDRPELLDELKQIIHTLQLKIIRAEISTVGGRVKNVFVMTREGDVDQHLTASIHQALKSILDRINLPPDFLPRTSFSSKRRQISPFESSTSSS